MVNHMLSLGTSINPISLEVTDEARQLLNQLPGYIPNQPLADHIALLETIAIGRVANGDSPIGITIGASDILRIIHQTSL